MNQDEERNQEGEPPEIDLNNLTPGTGGLLKTMAMVVHDLEKMKAEDGINSNSKKSSFTDVQEDAIVAIARQRSRSSARAKKGTESTQTRCFVTVCCCILSIVIGFSIYGLIIAIAIDAGN